MRTLVEICNELLNKQEQPFKNIGSFEYNEVKLAIKIQKNEILQQRNNILAKLTGTLTKLINSSPIDLGEF